MIAELTTLSGIGLPSGRPINMLMGYSLVCFRENTLRYTLSLCLGKFKQHPRGRLICPSSCVWLNVCVSGASVRKLDQRCSIVPTLSPFTKCARLSAVGDHDDYVWMILRTIALIDRVNIAVQMLRSIY